MLPPRNVLIFHLAALGDFILTWPLALALGRLYPQSRIFYVTHRNKGLLAEEVLRVESIEGEARWHSLFGRNAALPPACAKLLAGAHSIFTFQSNGHDSWSDNVRRFATRAELIALQPLEAPRLSPASAPASSSSPSSHAAQGGASLVEQLRSRPAIATAVEQILRSIAARGVGYRRTPDGSVLIHPGSGAREKCWPARNFLELARRMRGTGRTVRIVLGEVELERWTVAEIQEAESACEVVRPADCVQLLDVVKRASVFIGNDSGPGHLAGIIGTPTYTLFGPTDPGVWKPLGPDVHVLHRPPLADLGVDEVMDWVKSEVHAASESSA